MRRQFIPIVAAAVAVAVLAAAMPASAGVYDLYPSSPNWYSTLTNTVFGPGDEIILHEGTYSSSGWLPIQARGTAANPVILRGAEGEARPIITKSVSYKNNMELQGCQYLTVRGLELTGGDTGIRMYKSDNYEIRNVTVENCYIHDIGGVGITANHEGQTYEGVVLRRNEICRTGGHGEGFYLGSNYEASTFRYGTIEWNYIHDLGGSQGDGIEIKDGSYGNIIRDNVVVNPQYPGIIVYGTNGLAYNVIERNFIYGGADHGIQAAADAVIRNNIIINSAYDGIHSHHHQTAVPGNLDIRHNTVINPGEAVVKVSTDEEGTSGPITVANNAYDSGYFYLPSGSTLTGNVDASASDFVDLAAWNVFPAVGSALIGAGNTAYVVADDFNATPRNGVADAGAYLYSPDGNPGWALTSDFKEIPEPLTGLLLSVGGIALLRRRRR